MASRVVVLIDMDCFYCQVEVRLNPSLKGKPLAVVQYNTWKGGGIIAVNYEARAFGVTRHMRGNEAKKICPDIILVRVSEVRGKADLAKYRNAGDEVADVFCQFSDCVQRASVDEAYMDLTEAVETRLKAMKCAQVKAEDLPSTFIIGYDDPKDNGEESRLSGMQQFLQNVYNNEMSNTHEIKLAVGGVIVEEMRQAVFEQTGFRCSAGISYNKILAKLACGVHKPNRQSILPSVAVPKFFESLPVRKVRNLGGKFGDSVVEDLGCNVMADLLKFSERELQQKYDEKSGSWLYKVARGIDNDPVTQRLVTKSIGCCKKFPGRQALSTKESVEHWLEQLANEVSDRLKKDLEMNKRRAKLLTVHWQEDKNGSLTRSVPLPSYESEQMVSTALGVIQKTYSGYASLIGNPPLKYLGLSAGKFQECNENASIQKFFKAALKDVSRTDARQNVSQVKREESDFSGFEINFSEEKEEDNIPKKEDELVTAGDEKDEEILSISPDIKEVAAGKSRSFFMHYLRNQNLNSASRTTRHRRQLITNGVPTTLELSSFTVDANSVTSEANTKENRQSTSDDSSLLNKTQDSSNGAFAHPVAGPSTSDNRAESDSDIFISLSELFPDINDIDETIIPLLPENLQKQLESRRCTHAKKEQEEETDIINVVENDGDVIQVSQKRCTPIKLNNSGIRTDGFSSEDILEPQNDFEEEDRTITEMCPHCNKEINLSEYPEHLDYHAAINLDKELNSVQVRTVAPKVQQNSARGSTKRKKGRPVKNSGDKKIRNIKSFFEIKQ